MSSPAAEPSRAAPPSPETASAAATGEANVGATEEATAAASETAPAVASEEANVAATEEANAAASGISPAAATEEANTAATGEASPAAPETASAAETVPAPAPTPLSVLFIGGLGRSGSTLLDRVFGQIPVFWSTGEMVQVWQAFSNDVRCGCGELPRDCPFWTAVIEQAFGGWDNLDVARLWAMQRRVDRNRHIPLLLFPRLTRRLAPSFAREMRSYVEDLIRLYAAIQQVSGASVLVDSGKYTSYAYLLKQLAGKGAFRLFVIHLVRDPRGVAYSWTKLTKKSEHADAKNMGQHPPAKTALRWVANNLLFELLARTSARTQRLRYEDFVEAPEGTVRALLDRAQIPAVDTSSVFPDPHTVDLTLANHTVAGNPMRFRTGRIEVRGDDQWRDKMPARQRRVVSLITAPLRWLYGYRD